MSPDTFRAALLKIKVGRGWNHRQLAEALGAAPSSVYTWMTGVHAASPRVIAEYENRVSELLESVE